MRDLARNHAMEQKLMKKTNATTFGEWRANGCAHELSHLAKNSPCLHNGGVERLHDNLICGVATHSAIVTRL